MKYIFILLLMSNTAFARNWVCNDSLNINFPTGTETHLGKWIRPGTAYAELTFDIDKIEKIYVTPIIFKDKQGSCEHENVQWFPTQGNLLVFNKPFSDSQLDIYIRIPSKRYIDNGKITFSLIIIKTINGKKISYFKNFTFNINYGEG